jgi:hypothetical protein
MIVACGRLSSLPIIVANIGLVQRMSTCVCFSNEHADSILSFSLGASPSSVANLSSMLI